MSKRLFALLSIIVVASVLLTACGSPKPTIPLPTETLTPRPPTETPTITFTPMPGVGSTWISSIDGMTMLFVPAGEFSMGSETGRDDEKPVHTVYLDSFWIDQTEVTNTMFAKFVDDSGYVTDAEKAGSSYAYKKGDRQQVNGADWNHPHGPDSTISGIGDHPVVQVSWNDAKAYCDWRGDGTRLPTEAEWEKAASWDDAEKVKRVYPWGNTFVSSLLNFCDKNCFFDWADKSVDDEYEFTSPVGHYPDGASFYGVLDMAGNVWEWVADWYSETFYTRSPASNPLGPVPDLARVLRGGSWSDGGFDVRSSHRGRDTPVNAYYVVGFRCALSP